jgi:predicted unusual protein kinase regulating ubiquinone biosynthesis (AarF/ABC1/UbiB family)
MLDSMGDSGDSKIISSPVGRLARLGGLVGRVGASVLAERLLELATSGPGKQIRRTENLVKNATRVAESLGRMKGAAMKVGQMISLQDGMLPREVAEVLRSLQREAPRVPAEVMRYEVEGSLGKARMEELFAELESEAFAAASIGQVHLGRLRDGRRVAVKIQYPLIDEIIRADLKNLKTLLGALVGMFLEIDFEPIWAEVRDRLLEEVDYRHEAENMRRMRELHAGMPEIIIPEVVEEASTERVLTMEYIGGIGAAEACSEEYPQQLRDRWGRVLFELQMRGMLVHRLLHADPNLANFAFRENGSVVVYDFGCVKRVSAELAAGYAELLLAALAGDASEIPTKLLEMGVGTRHGEPLPREVLDQYFELLVELLREDPPYTFGEDEELYDKIFALGMANWSKATDISFPQDLVFIDRSLAGHFGNLVRLGATGPWRQLVREYAEAALAPAARNGRTGC